MFNKFDEATDKFNQLTVKKRLVFTLVLISLCFMLFDLFWFSENTKNITNLENKVSLLVDQQNELIQLQQQSNSGIIRARNNPKYTQLDQINQQIAQTENDLSENITNLVKPSQMAEVLRTIINSSDNLQLIRISKLNSVELSGINSTEKTENETTDDLLTLYQHSMEIELIGSFNESYHFLKQLESVQKKLSFDRYDFQVEEHPNAKVVLIVSTISLQKEWIGG